MQQGTLLSFWAPVIFFPSFLPLFFCAILTSVKKAFGKGTFKYLHTRNKEQCSTVPYNLRFMFFKLIIKTFLYRLYAEIYYLKKLYRCFRFFIMDARGSLDSFATGLKQAKYMFVLYETCNSLNSLVVASPLSSSRL